MRILHTISTVNPARGGPIEGIKQLAAVNRLHGHEIEVVSLDPPDSRHLQSVPLPVYAMGPGWLNYSYSNRLLPWLRENAKHYDAVIINGIWQYHSFATWLALNRTEIPYVLFTHGMLDPWFKKTYPLKHFKKLLYWPWGEYRVLRDARAVLFTCEEERLLARQSFPSRFRWNEIVVNYGTAGPSGAPQSQLESFYTQCPELRGKRLAIFLGRLHVKKGCDLLLRAFAKVLAPDADWQLVICGPDQNGWRRELESMAKALQISHRITWAGMVSGELKWGALHAAEIFVLPSHQENFGIVVAEALACATPVLMSNKVNIWREIEGDGAGVVAEDDLEGTCSLLKAWLGMSSEQHSEMRRRALACFHKRFEIDRAATTLIEVLTGVAKQRSARERSSCAHA